MSCSEKILRELDYPEPPLLLEDVRRFLDLDRGYFTADDDGLLQMVFSRLKRAGKQVLSRPMLLADVIKEFDLRALYIPDRKKILIDDSVPKPKHRWLEAHEIGHDILPWHHEMMLGDDDLTPTAAVHDKLEAEANFAAGSLVFLGTRFVQEAKATNPSIEAALKLKKVYGNTLTTTLWRLVEHAGEERPIIALIGQHPRRLLWDKPPFRHVILSPAFDKAFKSPNVEKMMEAMTGYCRPGRGPLGQETIILFDRDGAHHEFIFETFFNSYDALTLGVHSRKLELVLTSASI